MSRTARVPSYRLHKPSGLAVVTIAGEDRYLGPHGTPASREAYDRLIAEWLVGGRMSPAEAASGPTVSEAAARYLAHAASYYLKEGSPTGQLARVTTAMGFVTRLYGSTPARDFGPLRLKACRTAMVQHGWCRRLVNQSVNCVRLGWRWLVEEELVPPSAHHALMAVKPLMAGRTEAPDYPPVLPAPIGDVEASLTRMPPVLAAVARFQLLTAARPGEALSLRVEDIDRSSEVWLYRPSRFKTQHRRKDRVLFIGPKARAIIEPWLDAGPYVFCPAVSMMLFRARQRAKRKTPVQPSQRDRSKASPAKSPGQRYLPPAYARAVEKACRLAGVAHWHPHQLRHNAATALVEQFGWEIARIVLGHSSVEMTRIYAEDSIAEGKAAMLKFG